MYAIVEGNDAMAMFDIKTEVEVEVGVCMRDGIGRVGHWGR